MASKIFVLQVDEKRGFFDVTMGAHDGTEVCELVGTFVLEEIRVKYDKNSTDLYQTTGCQYLKTQLERTKKDL